MRKKASALIPLPPGEIPSTFRCVQVYIPDSDVYEQELVGLITRATAWINYERDSTHKATAVAAAWRAALLQSSFGGCVDIQFQQDLCGLSVSLDGGTTWTLIYDGMDCLTSQGAQEFFDGLIDDRIRDLIEDGTLQQQGGQPGPVAPPVPETCHEYHVVLRANEKWKIPEPLSERMTVQVSNAHGGWTDGAFQWYCWDGKIYVLGVCTNDMPYQSGDPLQAGNHMALIGGFGVAAHTYFALVGGLYTVPLGVHDQEGWIQANDQTLYDNSGQIELDIQICTPAALPTWCHEWDFISSNGGWNAINPPQTHYTLGSGWASAQNLSMASSTWDGVGTIIDTILISYQTYGPRSIGVQVYDNTLGSVKWGIVQVTSGTLYQIGGLQLVSGHIYTLRFDASDARGISVTKVKLTGRGTSPWGSSNC